MSDSNEEETRKVDELIVDIEELPWGEWMNIYKKETMWTTGTGL